MNTTIGLLAGLLTTGCWLPQLLRSWRTRSTTDISWTYLTVLAAGVCLWILYGAVTTDVAVITTNVATAAALLTLASFKARFERQPKRQPALIEEVRRAESETIQTGGDFTPQPDRHD
jgi:MtN3 and saliva related transmembrane protein